MILGGEAMNLIVFLIARGISLVPEGDEGIGIGGLHEHLNGPARPSSPLRIVPMLPDTYQWTLVDSSFYDLMVPPGGRCVILADSVLKRLVNWEVPDWPLTPLATQAVRAAPTWLQDDMADNLSFLSPELQDTYALYVLNSPDPRFVDEIAFQVAHVSPEILSNEYFYPQLILVNTQYMYQMDSVLGYVRILDYPGPDYYSTTTYRMVNLSGDTVDYQIDHFFYYYYIVHPELSDEMPRMDWWVYNRWWRDFYAYYHDSGYPLFVDSLARARVVWTVTDHAVVLPADRPFDDTCCALNMIGNWVSRTVNFSAVGNRPIEPNIIAKEHDGNCGELQDALAAAGRTGLVPMTSICTFPEDHVWNEFYLDDSWHPMQIDLGFNPTHINDSSIAYDAGKHITEAFEWRSDGHGDTHTHIYSRTCSLTVYAYDRDTTPIEGARVVIYGEWTYGRYYSGWAFTDEEGRAEFELGDSTIIMIKIYTGIGSWPVLYDTITVSANPGEHFYEAAYLDSVLPCPHPGAQPPGDSVPVFKIQLNLDDLRAEHHGYARCRVSYNDSQGFNHYYNELHDTGYLSVYLADSVNYAKYMAGEDFEALYSLEDYTGGSLEFLAPRTSGKWYLLLSNEKRLSTTQLTYATVRLWFNAEAEVVEKPGPVAFVFSVAPCPAVRECRAIFSAPALLSTSLRLYDASGRLVSVLYDGPGDGKVHTADLAGQPGTYFLRLVQGERSWVKRVVILE